jgi:hypothetical protein
MQPAARKKTPCVYYFLAQCYNIAIRIVFKSLRAKVTDPDSGGVRSTAAVRYRLGQGQLGAMTQGIPRSGMQPIQ